MKFQIIANLDHRMVKQTKSELSEGLVRVALIEVDNWPNYLKEREVERAVSEIGE